MYRHNNLAVYKAARVWGGHPHQEFRLAQPQIIYVGPTYKHFSLPNKKLVQLDPHVKNVATSDPPVTYEGNMQAMASYGLPVRPPTSADCGLSTIIRSRHRADDMCALLTQCTVTA